jgi:hypothetical protein
MKLSARRWQVMFNFRQCYLAIELAKPGICTYGGNRARGGSRIEYSPVALS